MDQDTDELNAAERRVIELSRSARTPGDADKRRVRAALAVSLGVVGVASGGAVASGAGVAKGAAALIGGRVLAAVVLVAAVGSGAYVWLRGPVQPTQMTAPVQPPVPAPVAAPVVEPVAPPAADPLLAELSLLQRAQRAMRAGQPRDALELAARHATLYPSSQMALERDALRVFALCALGRKSEARTLATGLLAQAPRSPLRTSLEESCAMR